MEGGENEQLCSNCKRYVSSANFTTHSAYCEKNIFLCKICHEPVQKTERNEHLKEYHVTLQCDLCEAALEKWMLPEHMEICPRRLVKCEYCEAEFPLDGYSEHVDFCGSRTEKCLLCQKYIMMKDEAKHTQLHRCEEKYKKKMDEIEQNELNEMISDLEKHTDGMPSKPKRDNSGFEKERAKRLDPRRGGDPRIGANFEGANELVAGEAVCNTRQTAQDSNIQPREEAVASPLKPKENLSRYGECHICKQLIPWIDMNTHIPSCATTSGKCSVCGEDVPRHGLKNHMKEHFSGISQKMPVKEPQQSDSYLKKKPSHNNQACVAKVPSKVKCQYCSKPYFEDQIRDHVECCPKNMYECPLCSEEVPVKDKFRHEHYECRKRFCSPRSRCQDLSQYDLFCENNPEEFGQFIRSQSLYPSRSAFRTFFECPLCSENVPEEGRHRHETFDCRSLLKCSEPQGFFNLRVDSSNMYQCPLCLENLPEKDKKKHELFECKVLIENAGVHIPEPESYSEVPKGNCRCKCNKNFSVVCKCKNKIPENKTAEHKKSCQGEKIPCQQGKVPCRHCKEDIDVACVDVHLKYCPAMSSNKNFSQQKSSFQNSGKSNCEFKGAVSKNTNIREMMMPQTAKCKYCKTSFNVDLLKNHEDECVHRPIESPDCSKMIQLKDLEVHKCKRTVKKDKKIKINQEGPEENKEPGFRTKLWNYISKSDWNKGKDEGGNVKSQYQYSHQSNHYSSYGRGQDTEQSQPLYFSRIDDTPIPCEFCGEKFPASELVLHETGCEPDLVSYAKEDSSKDSNISESNTRQDSASSLTKSEKGLIPTDRVKETHLSHGKHPFFAENPSSSSSSTYGHMKYRRKSDVEPGEFLNRYEKNSSEQNASFQTKENEMEKKESFGIQSVWNATSFTDPKPNDNSNEISEYSVAMFVDQYNEQNNKYEKSAKYLKGNVQPASEEMDYDVTAMLNFLEDKRNNISVEEQNKYTKEHNNILKPRSSENKDSDVLNEDKEERHEKDFSNSKKEDLIQESTIGHRENLSFAAYSTKDKKKNVSKVKHNEDSLFDSSLPPTWEHIAHGGLLTKNNFDGPEILNKENISMREKEYVTDYKKHLSDFTYSSREKTPFSCNSSEVDALLHEKEYEKVYDQNDKSSTYIANTKGKKECVNSFKCSPDIKFGAHNSTTLSNEERTHGTVIQKKDNELEILSTHNLSRHTVSTKEGEECTSNFKNYFPDFKCASKDKRSVLVEDNKSAVLSKKNGVKHEILSEECRVKDKTVWTSNFNQLGDFKLDTNDSSALSSQNNMHETVVYEKKDDEPEKLCKQEISRHISRTKDKSGCISDFKKHFPDFKFATEKPSVLRSENIDKKHEKLSEQHHDKVKTVCGGNFSQEDSKFGKESTALFSENQMQQTLQHEKRDEPEKLKQQKHFHHIGGVKNEKEYDSDFSKYLPDFKFSNYKTKSSSKDNTYHASVTEGKEAHFEKSAVKVEPAKSSVNETRLNMDGVRKGLEDLETRIAKFHLQTLGVKVENEDPTKWSKWRETGEESSDSSDSE